MRLIKQSLIVLLLATVGFTAYLIKQVDEETPPLQGQQVAGEQRQLSSQTIVSAKTAPSSAIQHSKFQLSSLNSENLTLESNRANHTVSGRPVERSPQETAAAPEIVYTHGRLSVNVLNRPLHSVLEKIAQASGVVLVTDTSLNDETVSASFEDEPLEDGLRRLLSGYDIFILYNGQVQGAPIKAAWVYPAGAGVRLTPAEPDRRASNDELAQNFNSPLAEVRAGALETLVKRSEGKELETVLLALQDADENVRFRALDLASNFGLPIPEEQLSTLALSDPSPQVRMIAFAWLARQADHTDSEQARLKAIISAGLSDPDQRIQEQARQLMEQLEEPKWEPAS